MSTSGRLVMLMHRFGSCRSMRSSKRGLSREVTTELTYVDIRPSHGMTQLEEHLVTSRETRFNPQSGQQLLGSMTTKLIDQPS